MSWSGFALVFLAFFVSHSLPVRPAIKTRLIAAVGQRGFLISYSILSFGMAALLIWSARRAPLIELWPQMPWHRHAAHLGMLGVCLILGFAIARPNPFSFGGARNSDFDPAHPGISRVFRHPILAALALWAGVHLLPNGDLAHVLLFGVLGGFAITGRALINRRKQREMGFEAWTDLVERVAQSRLLSKPFSWKWFGVRLAVSFLLFAALLWLHPDVIGTSAL